MAVGQRNPAAGTREPYGTAIAALRRLAQVVAESNPPLSRQCRRQARDLWHLDHYGWIPSDSDRVAAYHALLDDYDAAHAAPTAGD